MVVIGHITIAVGHIMVFGGYTMVAGNHIVAVSGHIITVSDEILQNVYIPCLIFLVSSAIFSLYHIYMARFKSLEVLLLKEFGALLCMYALQPIYWAAQIH